MTPCWMTQFPVSFSLAAAASRPSATGLRLVLLHSPVWQPKSCKIEALLVPLPSSRAVCLCHDLRFMAVPKAPAHSCAEAAGRVFKAQCGAPDCLARP